MKLCKNSNYKILTYCLFGHVHSGDHAQDRIWGTRCWNVSRLNEDYMTAYDPLSIEIEERDNA